MDPQVSPEALGTFFAYAPLVLGLIIFLAFYIAKRDETGAHIPIGESFACSNCGRRGIREHMVPETHEGAVSWYCTHCAATETSTATAH